MSKYYYTTNIIKKKQFLDQIAELRCKYVSGTHMSLFHLMTIETYLSQPTALAPTVMQWCGFGIFLFCYSNTFFNKAYHICVKINHIHLTVLKGLTVMEFVESVAGGKQLLLNGYMYRKKATKKNRIRWECANGHALQCKGAVTTSLQIR